MYIDLIKESSPFKTKAPNEINNFEKLFGQEKISINNSLLDIMKDDLLMTGVKLSNETVSFADISRGVGGLYQGFLGLRITPEQGLCVVRQESPSRSESPEWETYKLFEKDGIIYWQPDGPEYENAKTVAGDIVRANNEINLYHSKLDGFNLKWFLNERVKKIIKDNTK